MDERRFDAIRYYKFHQGSQSKKIYKLIAAYGIEECFEIGLKIQRAHQSPTEIFQDFISNLKEDEREIYDFVTGYIGTYGFLSCLYQLIENTSESFHYFKAHRSKIEEMVEGKKLPTPSWEQSAFSRCNIGFVNEDFEDFIVDNRLDFHYLNLVDDFNFAENQPPLYEFVREYLELSRKIFPNDDNGDYDMQAFTTNSEALDMFIAELFSSENAPESILGGYFAYRKEINQIIQDMRQPLRITSLRMHNPYNFLIPVLIFDDLTEIDTCMGIVTEYPF